MPHESKLTEIDGSWGEGGGQIVRTAVSLSCILGKTIRITNIRANRKEPGLRPQHVQAIRSSADITHSSVEGAFVGSRSIEFIPGRPDRKVSTRIDVGTAGSTALVAQTLIPIALFLNSDFDIEIIGGTENPLSPTIDYLQRIAVPFYALIGGSVKVEIKRRGYYPRGGGMIRLVAKGSGSKVHSVNLDDVSKVTISPIILSVSRKLPQHVAKRQAESAEHLLAQNKIKIAKQELDSTGDSFSPGSSILIYCSDPTALIGSDALGQRGKRAELVGSEAAINYLHESTNGPSLDSHLADMAVTLLSCVVGQSSFSTSKITTHLLTNLRVASLLSGCNYSTNQTPRRNFQVMLGGRADS